MRSNFKFKLKVLVLSVALTIPTASYAALATVSAQWVQNGNLIRQASLQAKAVSQHILAYRNQLQQYSTMLMNLKNLPQGQIQGALAPYKDTIQMVGQVGKAVGDVYQASSEANSMYERRYAEIDRLKLDPKEYFMNEIELANRKGGIYKTQMDIDQKALDQVQEKSEALAKLGDQVGKIKGNVEGLDLLAQQNQVIATSLLELTTETRKQNLKNSTDSVKDNEAETKAREEANKKINEQYLADQRKKIRAMEMFSSAGKDSKILEDARAKYQKDSVEMGSNTEQASAHLSNH